MQKNLQLNQNTFIKKQKCRLSLEIEFSKINQTFYETVLNKANRSPIAPSSNNYKTVSKIVKPYKQPDYLQQTTQFYEQKIQKLQTQLQKQMIYLQKSKQLIKQRYQQIMIRQSNKEKLLKQLNWKRTVQIQNIKNQIKLLMRNNANEREEFFQKLQSQFNEQTQLLRKRLKKAKKQWKSHLKNVLLIIQNQPNKNKKQLSSLQQSSKQEFLTLKQPIQSKIFFKIRQQITMCLQAYSKESQQIQVQLSNLIEQFRRLQKSYEKRYILKYSQLQQVISKLQGQIDISIRKQQLQAQTNRQKLLLLLQENADRIQTQRIKHEQQKNNQNRFNYNYRHIK